MTEKCIDSGWSFRRVGEACWYPAKVPGSVYTDMMASGLMEDPFWKDNEEKALSLMEDDYEYETHFQGGEIPGCEQLLLRFEGLDTIADVYLNDERIGSAENMHRIWEYDVTGKLRASENTLRVVLHSPTEYIRKAFEESRTYGSEDAMDGFVHIRKAHCMFGWDWGAHLPDAGIFRPVRLLGIRKGRIESVYITQEHKQESVALNLQVKVQAPGHAGSAGGVAEEIVGEAVAHRRGDYILATKVGMKVGEAPEDENTSPEAIRIQLRRSLVRMRTDYVDVYYLHRYDPDTEPHAVARAMGEELRAGTIRAWGVSNYTAAQLAALLAAAADEGVPAPALCQPALSMLNTGALEELLPLCEKEGVGVVPYQLLQGGMLTGKYRRGQEAPAGSRLAEKPEWMKPFTDETYDVIERCAAEAAAEGVTMTQHALRWALAQPGVVSALVGVKREEQIDEAAGAVR